MNRPIEKLRKMLAERPPLTSLPERRRGFERMAEQFALPDNIEITPVELGSSLTGLWVRAENAEPERVVLYLHGGAFMIGSAAAFREVAARLSAASGASVLIPDYRLAPEHPFPCALDDARASLVWLANQGFEPSCTAIAGDSCGSNLACGAVLAAQQKNLAAAWLLSPYLDLTHSGASIAARADRDPFIDTATMEPTVQTYAPGVNPTDPQLSPLFADLAGFPPTLIQVGSEEVLFDDAWRFAQKLRSSGADVVFQEWVDMVHGWTFFGPMLPEANWAVQQAGAFIRSRFR